jgi:hypothetical protein
MVIIQWLFQNMQPQKSFDGNTLYFYSIQI